MYTGDFGAAHDNKVGCTFPLVFIVFQGSV